MPGGGVRLHPDICTGCGSCREACILGAISWDEGANKPIICVYCGVCATYCPYNVIELQDIPEVR